MIQWRNVVLSEEPDIVKELRNAENLGRLKTLEYGNSMDQGINLEIKKNDLGEEYQHKDEKIGFQRNISEDSIDSLHWESEILFQMSNDMFIYLDTSGRIVKINKAGLEFIGFSEKETIGKYFWKLPELFSEKEGLSHFLRIFENALRGEKTEDAIIDFVDKHKNRFTMEVKVYPITTTNRIDRILVVCRNITKLRAVEKKFGVIGEITNDLIALITFSLNPVFTYVSPSHRRIIGYEEQDLLGKPFFEFVHPGDKEKIIHLLEKYVTIKNEEMLTDENRDISEKIEFRFKDRFGNWHHIATNAYLLENEILSVSKDVTKEKHVFERLRLISKVTTDFIYEWDVKSDILEWSGRFEETLGYTAGEIPKTMEEWLYWIHPDDLEKVRNSIETQRTSTEAVYKEYRVRKKDGTWAYWEDRGIAITDEYKQPVRWIGGCRDITAQKEAESALKESRNELRMILDAAADGIRIIGRDFKVRNMNKTMTELAGICCDKGIGMPCRDMFEAEGLCGTNECSIVKVLKNKDGFQREETRRRIDGKKIPCLTVVTPLRDSNGNIIGIIEDFRDISEIKSTEKELRNKVEELEKYKKVTIGRELKMIELKREINKLKQQFGDS